MPRSRKPTPVHVKTECSLCGLDWDKHPDEPTVYDCVELLKVEAAKPPITQYVPYYPYPYQWTGGRPPTERPVTFTWKGTGPESLRPLTLEAGSLESKVGR
jgi:hypothetical protein